MTTKQDIETGILIALGVLFSAWIWQDWQFVLWGSIALAIALLIPVIFRPIAFLWFGLGRILGYIVPSILLVVVFYLLVTPVGMVRQWLSKDSLQLQDFNKNQNSILKDRNHTFQSDDLKHPF